MIIMQSIDEYGIRIFKRDIKNAGGVVRSASGAMPFEIGPARVNLKPQELTAYAIVASLEKSNQREV